MLLRLTLLALAALHMPCRAEAQGPPVNYGPLRYVEGPRRAAQLVGEPLSLGLSISLAPDTSGAQAFFDQGLTQIFYGGFPEAERSFQTILISDPDCPMSYWGLAQANTRWPVRARWFARAAWLKRGLAGPRERRLIDALASFYSVLGSDEPEGLVEPWNPGPGEDPRRVLRLSDQPQASRDAAEGLIADYLAIVESHPEDHIARALLVAARLQGRADSSADDEIAAEIHSILDAAPGFPVSPYLLRLWAAAGDADAASDAAKAVMERASLAPSIGSWVVTVLERAGRIGEAREYAAQTIENLNAAADRTWVSPSRLAAHRVVSRILNPDWVSANRWFALEAPDWTLDDAYGQTFSLKDYRGKPLLIVNFLGFGCVHCLEQLQALLPFASRFEELGVEIVAVGLQTPEELRVSMGEDPLKSGYPFPILCDPKLSQFKAYHSFDDFADTALHGTYLVDREGHLRWHDISHLPYMEIETLLDVCEQLVSPPEPAADK